VYVHVVTPNQLDSVLLNELHTDTLDIIVFSAGGWVTDGFDVNEEGLTHSCVYVAGQTAPGDGVGIEDRYTFWDLDNDSRDVVIRGMTFTGEDRESQQNALFNIDDAQRVILDQMNMWWAPEKHMRVGSGAATDTVTDISLTRILHAESANEPTSFNITSGDNGAHITRISLGRNLAHSNGYRNPNLASGENSSTDPFDRKARMVGNAWYNTNWAAVQTGGWAVDIIDSYFKSGPLTSDGVPSGNNYSWILGIKATTSATTADSVTEAYVERAYGARNKYFDVDLDSLWADGGDHQEVSCEYRDCVDPGGGGDPRDSLGSQAKRDTALTPPTIPLARIRPDSLWTELVGTATDSGQVGDWRRIQCDGTWTERSDSVHSALLKHARDSTGVSSSPDSTYVAARWRYTKAAGSACSDTDSDGMPNAFEVRIQGGTDSTGAAKHGDPDGDGWTNVEEYVNGSDPNTYTGATGGVGGSVVTYADLRQAYLIVVNDSIWRFFYDTLGAKVDSMAVRGPEPDSIDPGARFKAIMVPARDSSVVLTYDTLSYGALQDSAAVDSILADWGVVTPPDPWDVSVPGEP
jgi:hypothetical protein